MGKFMKPILAGSYVSDTNNTIKTPWGLTSDNSKVNYKMIDLNSTDRSLDQLKQLNNQLIFDEDKSEKIKKAIKSLNDPLPEDAYSIDELVEYKNGIIKQQKINYKSVKLVKIGLKEFLHY